MVGAAQRRAQDGQRLVRWSTTSPAQIRALEKQGYDVGYIGDRTEAAVYLDAQRGELLRAQGYTIGEVVPTTTTSRRARAEITRRTEGEALAAEVAENGLTKAAKAKGAASTSRVMS